ncbi:hypothetical protein [Bradyrhizobium sp. McL0616]|uniref:hypothetical protein n=1 Tax=Bradyrhizobium sp. McL0616 TaxID=3415674 RepID=UPI003CE699B2
MTKSVAGAALVRYVRLAGIVLVLGISALGVSPAAADCYSNGSGFLGSCDASTLGPGQATAVGNGAAAFGAGATAFGDQAGATNSAATAIGAGAIATASSTSLGSNAGDIFIGAGQGVTSIGAYANHRQADFADWSTAIGAGVDGTAATSSGAYSVAIGGGDGVSGLTGASSSGDKSVAIGVSSVAAGVSATAIGSGASVTADNAVALGNAVTASGTNAFAAGNNSHATGTSGIAIGDGANAGAGANAIAIGTNATAGFANSTAIGSGATATAPNQVAIGTASNTYRMAGVASAASLAAQSGPVSFVTTDAAGNLATSSFSSANITSLQSQVTSLQSQVTDNRLEARSGTAVALAAGSMPALQQGRKFALSAGYGNFEGANAFAVGATALLYDGKSYAIIANAGGGIGLERNVAGGRGAVSIQW